MSYDRHVYFIDFGMFSTGENDNSSVPVWFSLVRDPLSKFVSRFHYHRQIGKRYYPKTFGMGSKAGLKDWMGKDLDRCVLSGDPECQIEMGKPYDLTIVRANMH